MAITYTGKRVTIDGGYFAGTTSLITYQFLTYYLITVPGASFDSSAKGRLGMFTSGSGENLFFKVKSANNSTSIYVVPGEGADNWPVDNVSDIILFYTMDDVYAANTDNSWEIPVTIETYNTNFTANLQIGTSSTGGYFQIKNDITFKLPYTDANLNKNILNLESNSVLYVGDFQNESTVEYIASPHIIIDPGVSFYPNHGSVLSDNTLFRSLLASSTMAADNTKYIYLINTTIESLYYKSAPVGTSTLPFNVTIPFESKLYMKDSQIKKITNGIILVNTNNTILYSDISDSSIAMGVINEGGDSEYENISIKNVLNVWLQTVSGVTNGVIFKNMFFREPQYNIIGIINNYTSGQPPHSMTVKFINCTYWFGSTKIISTPDKFSKFDVNGAGYGDLSGCSVQEIKTVNYKIEDSDNVAINGATFYAMDKNGTEVVNTSSNSDGICTEQELILYKAVGTVNPSYQTDDKVEIEYNPHIFKFRKHGQIYFKKSIIVDNAINTIQQLENNPYITESTEATVAAYTGISINTTTEKITLTTNHTIQELYDYTQYWGTLESNIQYDELITTNNGENFIGLYDLEINNCTLSGSGVLDISAASKTYTKVGTGTSTLTIKDNTGTYTQVSFTGLPSNTEVRMYKVSDDTEVDGIENSSGTVTFPYVHTTDLEVYVVFLNLNYNHFKIDSLTLINTAATIPVSLSLDRNYNNP